MKTAVSLNLASVPFRKDRPMLIASLAVGLLMVGVLVMLVYLVWLEKDVGKETAAEIASVQEKLNRISAEEGRLQNFLRRPENAAVLERSVFLNDLLRRKGISWTLIFRDLEGVMPYNVKVLQVQPRVILSEDDPEHNEILLDLFVAAQGQEPVIEMLKALETSRLFGATAVSTQQSPTETEPLFRCKVSVKYAREL